MHTVERLEQALEQARELGYEVRHEWLGGSGGGGCQLRGKKILFVDLAQDPAEQLASVQETLEREPAPSPVTASTPEPEILPPAEPDSPLQVPRRRSA